MTILSKNNWFQVILVYRSWLRKNTFCMAVIRKLRMKKRLIVK